jgi:two-component system, LuxR family, response regulator FixJ
MHNLGVRVFVVDDDASVRKSLVRLLKSAGHEVDSFASAAELLKRAPFEDAGCLILDVQMPDLNGLELKKALERSNCAPPIIFITGHSDIRISTCAIEAGAVDFIPKPFNEETLMNAVGRALQKWRQDKQKSRGG